MAIKLKGRKEIGNIQGCVPLIVGIIRRNTQDEIMEIFPINENRQLVIITEKRMRYLVAFKREQFRRFGKIFDMEGKGESLNEELVDQAIRQQIHSFIFIYPDYKVYTIGVKELHDYAVTHGTMRKTKTGEITMSFSTGLLRRWQ